MAAGFAGSHSAPSTSNTIASSSTSTSGSGLIRSPSVSARGEHESSTVVAPLQRQGHHPIRRPQSSSWRPDPDGQDDSSLGYYGGSFLAYGGSFPCCGGSGLPSRSRVGSYGARPFHPHGGQYGGLSLHPRDVPPFIFQHHGVPVAPEHVLHAGIGGVFTGQHCCAAEFFAAYGRASSVGQCLSQVLRVPIKVLISHQCLAQFLFLWLMGGSLALFLHFIGGSILPLLFLMRFHKVLRLFRWLLQWSLWLLR